MPGLIGNDSQPALLGVEHDFVSTAANFAVRRQQVITDEHLDALAESRLESSAPAREFHRVASIPVAVVEQWMTEGFNVFQAPAREIVARLAAQDLGAFVTTNKTV